MIASVALFSAGALSGAGIVLHAEEAITLAASEPSARAVTLMASADSAPGITVSNKYIAAEGPEARPSMYPWLQGKTVLEPFKAATFTALEASVVAGPDGALKALAAGAGMSYAWAVKRPGGDQNTLELDLKLKRRAVLAATQGLSNAEVDALEPLNGHTDGLVKAFRAASADEPLVHTFTELGTHHVHLDVTYRGDDLAQATGVGSAKALAAGGSAGFKVLSAKATVVVKYVRREMHGVDDEDREALFAAWGTLLSTEDEDGVAAYGSDFRSHLRLSAEHNNLAGDRNCDHLHDGMGFAPGHISLTRLLEASLQSVDASVAFPYWEYTIDVEDVIANHRGDFTHWRKVLAFTDKWFGEADQETGHVTSGTFGEFELHRNTFTTKTNSYGLIRSPWNNLKDPQFARYFGGGSARGVAPTIFVGEDQMSTCAVLGDTLSRATTLGSFNGAAAGQAHGPIHMFTGGQSGTKNMVERMTSINLKARGADHNQMWGNGVTFFFSNIKSLWRYGLWTCPETCSEDTPQEECACGCDPDAIMASPAKHKLLDPFAESWVSSGAVPVDEWNSTLRGVLDLMCSYRADGGVVMGDHASSGAASDPSFWILHGAVERWLQLMRMQDRFVSEDWSVAVFDSNVHPATESCSGHHQDDKLVFGAIDGHAFTNGEYYDYATPKESNVPYVYDNFEWKHCEALGVDIANRALDDDAAQAEAEVKGKASWAGGTPAPAPDRPAFVADDDATIKADAPPSHDDVDATAADAPAPAPGDSPVGQVDGAYAVPLTSGM